MSLKLRGACFLVGFFATAALGAPSLFGRLRNFDTWMLSADTLRQNRYEIHLTQKSPISRYLTTLIEGRFRFDAGLLDRSWVAYNWVSNAVRSDEMVEASLRQFYLDDLEDWGLRLKVGLQRFDWIEAITPLASTLLTPLDLRHGAVNTYDQVIIPLWCLDTNVRLFGGTFEALVAPLPEPDRLPVGNNGFGLYSFLQSLASPLPAAVTNNPIPVTLGETEFGARYFWTWGEYDFTLMGYHGHQRFPSVTITPGLTQANIDLTYPQVNTYGIFSSYSEGSWVGRAFFLLQPQLGSRVTVNPLPPATVSSEDRFWRIGLGADYAASRAFKLYSETLLSEYTTTLNTNGQISHSSEGDAIVTVRATNETLRNVLWSLTSTVTANHFSYLVTPEMLWTFADNYKLTVGGRLVGANSTLADFAALQRTSLLYVIFEYAFHVH